MGSAAAGTYASAWGPGFGEVTTGRRPTPLEAAWHEMAIVTDEGKVLDFIRHVFAARLAVPLGRDYEARVFVLLMNVRIIVILPVFFGFDAHVKVARCEFVSSKLLRGCPFPASRGQPTRCRQLLHRMQAAAAAWLAERPVKACCPCAREGG